jgi:hypothetical protein
MVFEYPPKWDEGVDVVFRFAGHRSTFLGSDSPCFIIVYPAHPLCRFTGFDFPRLGSRGADASRQRLLVEEEENFLVWT